MFIYYSLTNLGNYSIFSLKKTTVTENAILYHWSVLFLKCIHNLTCYNHSRNFVYIFGILLNIVMHFSPCVQWLQQNIFLSIVACWVITSYNPVDSANDSEEDTVSIFRVDVGKAVKIKTAEWFLQIYYPSVNNVPHFEHEYGGRWSYHTKRRHKPVGIMNLRCL
jgi:hypothetical protein